MCILQIIVTTNDIALNSELYVVICRKVYRSDSAAVVRSSQELAPSPNHNRYDLDHLSIRLVADRSRHKLHGQATRTPVALHVLQRRLPHLFVDGVLLRPVRHHDRSLRQDLRRHPPSRAQEQGPRSVVVVGSG